MQVIQQCSPTPLPPSDVQTLSMVALKMLDEHHGDVSELLKDIDAARKLVTAMAEHQARVVNSKPLNAPIFMPMNKLLLPTMARGDVVILAGAPGDASEQFFANVPRGSAIAEGVCSGSAVMTQAEAYILATPTDLMVLSDLDAAARFMEKEHGNAAYDEMLGQLAGLRKKCEHVAFLGFARQMSPKQKDRARALGFRVITYPEGSGDVVFSGGDEAQAIEDKFYTDLEEKQKSNPKDDSSNGKVIVP